MLQAAGSGVDGPLVATFYGNITRDGWLLVMEEVELVAMAHGIHLQLRRGCIIANVTDAGGYTPEEVLQILVTAMHGACTRADLQIGMEEMLTWQPGAQPLFSSSWHAHRF